MSTKKKSKKPEKKVVFDDLSNNPYAVPRLSVGLHDEIYRVFVTEYGPLVQLNDRKVCHLDCDVEGDGEISIFDYSKALREAWCHLVGIKPKHLPQYAEEAMAEQRVADAKALLTKRGYLVSEPMA